VDLRKLPAYRSSDDLNACFSEAVEARDALPRNRQERNSLFVQTHPDVLVFPRSSAKTDQSRSGPRVIQTIYYRHQKAEAVYIFTESAFMKEAANALLKVLEEPPDFARSSCLPKIPAVYCRRFARAASPCVCGAERRESSGNLAVCQPKWTRNSDRW